MGHHKHRYGHSTRTRACTHTHTHIQTQPNTIRHRQTQTKTNSIRTQIQTDKQNIKHSFNRQTYKLIQISSKLYKLSGSHYTHSSSHGFNFCFFCKCVSPPIVHEPFHNHWNWYYDNTILLLGFTGH